MVGGAARSPVWPQIVADVTGVNVSLPAVTEAASWGAAVLAGIGVGVFEGVESAGGAVAARSQFLEPGNRDAYGLLYCEAPLRMLVIDFEYTYFIMEATMFKDLEFRMASWIPFQDQAACERARAFTRNDFATYQHPNLKVTILKDEEFAFHLAMTMFGRIKQAADAGRRHVIILPNPEPLYSAVAYLCNKFRVNCRNLYTFNMEECADQDGNIALETWENSFLFNSR